MLQKLLFYFLLVLVLTSCASLIFYSPSFAQEPATNSASSSAQVSSYELFWPLTAGITRGDKLYFLKKIKENLYGLIKIGNYKSAEYTLSLSEKRLVEAEKLLLVKKDYPNSVKTLEEADANRKKVISILSGIKNDFQKYELKRITLDSFKRQKEFSNFLRARVTDQSQELLNQEVNNLDLLLSQLVP